LESKDSFGTRVIQAQNEIKAPKGQYNSFGKYRFRSAEDILESAKPVLLKYGLYLTLSDEIFAVGDRIYVKAVATLRDTESEQQITVQAFAREPMQKKGFDEGQITGASSSYARKYAMNGLFCLDDTKDADTDEYHNQTYQKIRPQQREQTPQPQILKPNKVQLDALLELAKSKGFGVSQIARRAKVRNLEDMTMEMYTILANGFQSLPDVKQSNLDL